MVFLILLLLLPLVVVYCNKGGDSAQKKVKEKDKTPSARLRNTSMPKSKEAEQASSDQNSETPKVNQRQEKVEVKEKETKDKVNSKDKLEPKKPENGKDASFKFNSQMMMVNKSQPSVQTDLGSIKDEQNPLLDKTIQERLNKTKSVEAFSKVSMMTQKTHGEKTSLVATCRMDDYQKPVKKNGSWELAREDKMEASNYKTQQSKSHDAGHKEEKSAEAKKGPQKKKKSKEQSVVRTQETSVQLPETS